LARRAAAMGLGGRVRCLGHVERGELAALFRGALLFLYPTLYEGFGLPVLEAMACGVPVVAGDIPAVREVAGDAVERVNPRDVVALANTVRRLLDQAEHRRELAARGRARARLFSWQRAADATLSVYRAVAAEA
ncbi:MAG: putative glycosyltransferase, partial [Acidobacteria bacterium]|nr:putative glycosyltransferase [Acidobacteriota bacterium]